MSNLFRDNLYNEFPDPNKKIDGISEQVTGISGKVEILQGTIVSISAYPRLSVELDDTKRINRAISDVSSKFGGGKILFNPAVYEVSNSIVMMSNVELCGVGNSTVLKATDNSPKFAFMLLEGITGAKVTNMKIDGRVSVRNVASATGCIFITGSNHCVIDTVFITDFGYIPTSDSGGNFITLSAVEGGTDCYKNTIKNCRLIDSDGRSSFGIRLWTDWTYTKETEQYTNFVRDNRIENNYISGFNWNSVELAGPATINNIVTGNSCENLYGYSFVEADKGASYNLYAFNKCRKPTNRVPVAGFRDQGIPSDVGAYGTYPKRIAVGNQWVGNEVSGIVQKDGDSSSVAGMLFIRTKNSTVTNLKIKDVTTNNAGSNNVAGIQLDSECEDISISGGLVENAQTAIYMNGASRVTISGLNIKPIGYGYYSTAAVSSDIVLSSNTFKGCTTAVNANVETNIQIVNNTITDSTGSASIRLNSAKASVTGNSIANTVNTHYGVDSRQPNQFVANNRLTGCLVNNTDGLRSSIVNNYSDIDSKSGRVQTAANAIPTSGSWYAGDYVANKTVALQGTAPNRYVVKGWIRVTTGSNHVLNTDWWEERIYNGS